MAIHTIDEGTRGVCIIVPAPFDDAGAVDVASTDSLVDLYLDMRIDGITILDVLGEAPKLSGAERRPS